MTDTEFYTKVDERIDMKLQVLVENLNDQFQKVLDATEAQTELLLEKIQSVSDRTERTESDAAWLKLKIDSIKLDTKMLKLRSDRQENYHEKLEKRIQKLESNT